MAFPPFTAFNTSGSYFFFAFTVILHFAFLPFGVLTVMTAVPGFRALTLPALLTVATFLLLEDQVSLTLLELLWTGFSVALSLSVLPTVSLYLV